MKTNRNQANAEWGRDNETHPEGWGIFCTGISGGTYNMFELQRIDEDGIFPSDDEAIAHVLSEADKNPESVHADAIRWLAEYSPNEVDSIMRTAPSPIPFEPLLKKLNIQL